VHHDVVVAVAAGVDNIRTWANLCALAMCMCMPAGTTWMKGESRVCEGNVCNGL
jgi:hypothetical protein